MNITQLKHQIHSLMQSNQVQSGNYRYTRPAPSIYEQQWLWDSCFHAIIYTHLDLEMAKEELRALLHRRGVVGEGMVPHMVYWTGGAEALWGQAYTSFITQPPMIAHTAWLVYERSGDSAFLQEIYAPMADYYRWLLRARDHDGDYLLSLIHPWESGWDASPRWDALLGLSDPTPAETKAARFALAQQLKEVGQQMSTITQHGMFHIETVDYNAIYAANVAALAQIAQLLGHTEDALYFETLANHVKEAINTKMWDSDANFYWDLAGDSETWVKIPSAAAFIPLFAHIPTPQQAAHLIERLQTDFATPYMMPTIPPSHPTFTPHDYWRGTTWLNVNWFIQRGLIDYGYHDLAEQLTQQSLALVEQSGYREYYNPLTGEGLGSQAHSWSGIVLDMLIK